MDSVLLEFALVWALAVFSIGPNVIATLDKSIHLGLGAALYTVLGIAFASILHSTFTIYGVAVFLIKRPYLFGIITIIGGCYILYRSYKISRESIATTKTEQKLTPWYQLILDGLLVSLSNLQAILLYFAILPKYLAQGNGWSHYLAIQFITVFLVGLNYALIAVFATSMRKYIIGNQAVLRGFNFFSITAYLIIGLLIIRHGTQILIEAKNAVA